MMSVVLLSEDDCGNGSSIYGTQNGKCTLLEADAIQGTLFEKLL
jgi:hypothetical protein